MSGRFVRQSAFRHVFGTPAKKEETFNDLRPEFAGQTGHITANHKYFAIALGGGGGPVQILSLKGAGRQDRNPPKLAVHKGQVLDFEFNPFVSNMIATASEDCYVKVSQFPEGGLNADINNALVTLEGHQKKVVECHFHPTSANVLATTAQDNTLKIWDIEQQAEKINIATSDNPWSFDWNTNGSLVALSTKDKNVSILDPRAPAAATVVEAFAGNKQSAVRWMDNHNFLCTIGFTKNSMRHFALWDPRALVKPVNNVEIDQSPGVLIPYYDPDNSILYLGGKGDGGIKYFEIVPEGDEKAFFLAEYRTNVAQKGLGFVPKRACNTKACEVAIALRVMRDAVIPVSMTVPRKSDMFQADIFPNTRDTTVSTQSAGDYFDGKNADVVMMSMNPKDRGVEEEVVQNFVAQKSAADLQRELDVANARIAELEAELAKLKG